MRFILLLPIIISSCVTTSDSNVSSEKDIYHGTRIAWYQGSVEEAFEESKDEKKPLFLYWGAVWCPPCNEIKSQVFSHPKADGLLKTSIPVYLDGDQDEAQKWADRLKVAGYPTILLLSSDGRELMRISESLTFAEFQRAYQSSVGQTQSFERVLSNASKGKAGLNEWRMLAYFSWHDAKDLDVNGLSVLSKRRLIARKVPSKLAEEESLLNAGVLAAAAKASAKKKPGFDEILNAIKADGEKSLDKVFASYRRVRAARAFINYQSKPVLSYLFDGDPKKMTIYQKKWIEAARKLREDRTLSTDTRLWSVYPEIMIHEINYPSSKTKPHRLKESVKMNVRIAEGRAKSDFERAAVISGAAYLLRHVGFIAEARDLLKKELKKTKTPWYYEGALASLEEKLGHKKSALYWSDKARRSAKGRASRIQWAASDLLRNVRLASKEDYNRVKYLTTEFYKLVTVYPDGFSGRNRYRLDAVAEGLKSWSQYRSIRKDLAKESRRCKSLENRAKTQCNSHFAAYVL